MSEYIYCLKNDVMPGLYKLGFSENPYRRMDDLFTTGVPMMFECIYVKSVKSMKEAEAFLFTELEKYRFNLNREFFKLDVELIKEAFDKIQGEYRDVSKFNKPRNTKHQKKIIIEEEDQCDSMNDEEENEDNDDFKCKRCNAQFSNKFNLKSHLQRKNPCKFIQDDLNREKLIKELYNKNLNGKTYDCEYCNTQFNHSSGKSRHKKICKFKPLDKISILENSMKQLTSKINQQQIKIEKLEEQSSKKNNPN
jgi:hypothetical protein